MKSLRIYMIKTYIFLIIAFLLNGCSEDPSGPSITEMFDHPDECNTAMTWDGTYLWMGGEEYCHKVSKSGEIVSSFYTPGGHCGAIEWDGSHLWTHDGGFYGHGEPAYPTIYQVTTSGEIISSFSSPVYCPHEIVWDGTCLWIYGGSFSGLADWYKLSTSGEILYSMDPSLGNHGAAWDGQYLWSVVHPSKIGSGGRYSKLFSMNMSGEIIDLFIFEDLQFWGLAFDGNDFWVIVKYIAPDVTVCKISDF